MPAGAIVLLQRGTCGELAKLLNAQAAGAGAIVYINEGNAGVPGRVDPRWFDMTGAGITVPIVRGAGRDGRRPGRRRRARASSARPRGSASTGARARIPTRNVIAETHGGDPNKVIVVGAHLDSVGTGPGINDNGSGSAAILEIAEQLRRRASPKNKIRFIWFSAEESGLLGSEAYVASLPRASAAEIAAMLNFDMIGSPNFVSFVYDGDLSDSPPIPEDVFAPEARPFSATIEQLFLDYFEAQADRERADGVRRPLGLRAVHRGRASRPAASSPAPRASRRPSRPPMFGGTAGEQFDPCYHLGCDDFCNLNDVALDQNSDAAAHATITLAQSDIPDRAAAPAPAARTAARAGAPSDIPEPLSRSARRAARTA